MPSYSVKCVEVRPDGSRRSAALVVEQRITASDPVALRTFVVDVPFPEGEATQAEVNAAAVAAATEAVAAWQAAQDEREQAKVAAADVLGRYLALVGQSVTVTV